MKVFKFLGIQPINRDGFSLANIRVKKCSILKLFFLNLLKREFNYDQMIPSGYEPIKLSSGDDHTAIIFKDSQSNDTILLLMGSNHFGQLGRMPTDDADDSYYNLIGQFEYESDYWLPIDIWCGSNHTVIKSRRQKSKEIGYFTLGYDEEKIFEFNSNMRRLSFELTDGKGQA